MPEEVADATDPKDARPGQPDAGLITANLFAATGAMAQTSSAMLTPVAAGMQAPVAAVESGAVEQVIAKFTAKHRAQFRHLLGCAQSVDPGGERVQQGRGITVDLVEAKALLDQLRP